MAKQIKGCGIDELWVNTHRREVLTGALISSSQQVGPNHGPDPEETDADGYKVDRPVAGLQNPPGQYHQDRDHKTVQQLVRQEDRQEHI